MKNGAANVRFVPEADILKSASLQMTQDAYFRMVTGNF